MAKDSLYAWDFAYDCEQEGAIRFRDRVTDKVGFLDKNGRVLITAAYNDAKPFYNGLALVIHDGNRIYADGTLYNANACEHWSWDGVSPSMLYFRPPSGLIITEPAFALSKVIH